MHFQMELYRKKTLMISESKMQQYVQISQISEISMQQTFHVLEYKLEIYSILMQLKENAWHIHNNKLVLS